MRIIMRILQINATCGVGSTGRIAVSISEMLTAHGVENKILYSVSTNGFPDAIACGKAKEIRIQALKSRVLGNYGFNSRRETKRILAEIKQFQPDTVLLHNIHGHDCNLEMLFSFLKAKNIKIVWLFHDCWGLTGYCTHFTYDKCDRWKSECHHCPQRKQYSWFFDRSKELHQRKKKLFSDLDLTIVTPSQWLADLVELSFLKDYPVKVIHNGIDLSIFRPTPSDFRDRYKISADKFILLGVAYGWGKRKGLDVFVELAKRLPSERFQIVLVGTDNSVDKMLPENIISIHRTQNRQELAEIYTAADLFVNPTREEVLGLVNLEANACGTPVLTFETGGSPECIDENSGMVVPYENIDAMEREIVRIQKEKIFTAQACVEHAKQFDEKSRFEEYIQLLMGDKYGNCISFQFL